MNWQERALQIGPEKHLVGVLTRPASPRPGARPLLLLNAGLMHHVGPVRLHVRLARHLAEHHGIASLRVDGSGLGDSLVRRVRPEMEREIVEDVHLAVWALLAATGAPGCVAGGVCAASDNAFRAALPCESIAGLLQIDGWAHPTAKFRRTRALLLAQRSASPQRWRNRLVRLQEGLQSKPEVESPWDAFHPESRPFPSPEWVAEGYAKLVARGVRFLAIFSGQAEPYYNYEGQLRDCYEAVPFGDLLEERRVQEADHLFKTRALQEGLIASCARWLASFGEPAEPPARDSLTPPGAAAT
jgi:hypothetical protein